MSANLEERSPEAQGAGGIPDCAVVLSAAMGMSVGQGTAHLFRQSSGLL